ncbi:60S ribosomal protein L9B [Coemansia sp. RSA 2706]|nr:60S ribosomal protein L9B [Coemansia sp. RSA 2711]KAJ2308970.1 60S ribosomal protein L9B [Coemansia sp. RSA 2706]KAJ2310691.1 60S ribosomal protein L9B [Coemansia sp. RSA 2705]KAJ2318135.1 60S ribosomal protein L9B [Coemansia sp. RSA 2704]KAJ2330194.1 60S ribosomal protein L9B [Coemansia sp. RSA 2702]KAJ2362518.1 60S ribosomal protein L9B [Coemansia sp. RSA 2610]KAJ2388013.1 60S ribosomal protein L9B [Coemansia sp. RSA 2611]KAJ2739956.1 60S ribosomal protein L9B [Coemansia sp. Cherry 401B
MKHISKDDIVTIPEGVTVAIKARQIRVTGPRGTLTRDLRHIQMDIQRPTKSQLRVIVWKGGRKHVACIRTVCSQLDNLIKGVTVGFEYKLRYVYAHFPIMVDINQSEHAVEIRNFLGERVARKVVLDAGVSVEASKGQKDELVLSGNDVDQVSQCAAAIQQSTRVRNKDIRKFLDGIYVSEKGHVVKEI